MGLRDTRLTVPDMCVKLIKYRWSVKSPAFLRARLVVTVALARSASLITQLSPRGTAAVIWAGLMTRGWRRGAIKAGGDWKAASRFPPGAERLGGHSGGGSWQQPHKVKCSACKWVSQTFSRFYLFKSCLVLTGLLNYTHLALNQLRPIRYIMYPVSFLFCESQQDGSGSPCRGRLSLSFAAS